MDSTLRILHLEDDPADKELILRVLQRSPLQCEVISAATPKQFLAALESGPFDLVLSDNSIPGMDGNMALSIARSKYPQLPFIFLSGATREEQWLKHLNLSLTECFAKSDLKSLPAFIERYLREHGRGKAAGNSSPYANAMETLISVIQELSLSRDLSRVMEIVRHSARKLMGADGASFVLREGNQCHYAEEDAIEPLWKGRRFPMSVCVSGWVMLHRQPAVIEDIYADPRVPVDAYRPTFVKSLVMVPIRTRDPVGAIGVYWAARRVPQAEEIRILQALADSTSVAMENVQLYSGLEEKVRERAAQLESLNRELETFSYSVSHDLRAPLRHVVGYLELLQNESGQSLPPNSVRYMDMAAAAARRMNTLIDDLLHFSRTGRSEMVRVPVQMNDLVQEVIRELELKSAPQGIRWQIEDLGEAECDRALLKQVWVNLLSNAVKYSSKKEQPEIAVSRRVEGSEVEFLVRDNGVGFDSKYSDRLFGVFQRLHAAEDFEGNGIGLANAHRIVVLHGGRIWAESRVSEGATFHFTLPASKQST